MRIALALALALSCHSETPGPPAPAPREKESAAFDVLIRNGTLIDGTGSPRLRADIAIRNDTIAAIGDLANAPATVTIDATNHVVAPGFIDLLGNSQAAVLIDPRLEGKIRQGVTTEVTGEGHSPAPQNDVMLAEMERTKPKGWPRARRVL